MPENPHDKFWAHPGKRNWVPPESGSANSSYVELQVKTNFSFLRGASHPEEYVERAVELGYKAISICDINTLAGVVRAHIAAKEFGIQLIVGSQLALYREIPKRLDDEETVPPETLLGRWESLLEPFSLIAYPVSKSGYGSLSKLLTLGKSRAPKGCCYLLLEDVLKNLKECLLIAVIADPFHERSFDALKKLQQEVLELSLAISDTYGPDQRKKLERILGFGSEFSLPLVVTNDLYFHDPDRRPLQDVMTCIRRGVTIDQIGLELFQNAERFLKSPDEMRRIFRRFPQAVERTAWIAEQTKGFSLDQLKYEYPREICPEELTPMQYLEQLSWKGAAERYPKGVPEKVARQIEHELRLIDELNYPKYFLTVYDIVVFARSQNILCQGRGAAANSAICYCLGITSVDPDQINLLFERFISKERNEPPDIDIDFEHERREEVIQYVYNKYGRHRAALVAEVVTYRTRSATREVAKAFGFELEIVESLVRLLTRYDEARSLFDQLSELGLDSSNSRLHLALKLAQQLAGFPRHLSQHVGGFVISETPLTELVPIENASMADRTVIEWDKDDVDAMGMLKVDCLGLGMLTCIRKAFDLVNALEQRSPEEALALHKVPQEDPCVYDMICEADTIGVFQIESRAQMTMLPRLRPRTYYDLVIEVAIVRPGPIQGGMVHPYLRRRMGKEKPNYPSKEIERVLGPTLGVPIFQEQAMELTVVAAGFTRGEADQLRRAMASWKRNKNSLRQFEAKIITGMMKNGYSKEYAEQCFNQIKGFGEYGFPQSHSASFALLVYVSSWLKKHYPEAFCAALINSQPMGFYQPSQIIQDAERHGISVLPIDVNFSEWDCTLERKRVVRAGMRLVRGIAEVKAKALVEKVRLKGPFKSVMKLWRDTLASVHTLRTLARADAYQSFGLSRQQIQWELQRLKDHSLPLMEQIESREEEVSLPAFSDEEEMKSDYYSSKFSLKSHPFTFLREELNKRGVLTTQMLREEARNGKRVALGGLVIIRQQPPTAAGFIFVTVEDETGTANLIIRPNVYRVYRDILYDSVYLLVRGRVQKQEGVTHLMVEEAENLRPIEEAEIDIVRNFF